MVRRLGGFPTNSPSHTSIYFWHYFTPCDGKLRVFPHQVLAKYSVWMRKMYGLATYDFGFVPFPHPALICLKTNGGFNYNKFKNMKYDLF